MSMRLCVHGDSQSFVRHAIRGMWEKVMRPTSTAFVPTSITAAPSLIQSPFTSSGLPIAATTMSAVEQSSCALGVLECRTVTVASLLVRSIATGMPTILLRPTTTAFLPEISTPDRSRSSMTPCIAKQQPHQSASFLYFRNLHWTLIGAHLSGSPACTTCGQTSRQQSLKNPQCTYMKFRHDCIVADNKWAAEDRDAGSTSRLRRWACLPWRDEVMCSTFGVQLTNSGSRPLRASEPMLKGWKPSTSFSKLMASKILFSSMCFGNGSWTRIPWTSGLALYSSTT